MPTFVRYNLKTGEIFSQFTTSSDEFIPLPNTGEEGVMEVPEDQLPKDARPSTPGVDTLRGKVTDGKLQRLRREPAFPVQIEITADLEDRFGDGSLVAPADGETIITLRATIAGGGKSKDAKPATIRFRTTRGTLSQRFAEAQDGVAEVQLKAITETTEAVVTASTEGSGAASLTIEFIPVDEYASAGPEDEPA
jgi:hypothetical protein